MDTKPKDIRAALRAASGSMSDAAETLGVSAKTLRRRVVELGMETSVEAIRKSFSGVLAAKSRERGRLGGRPRILTTKERLKRRKEQVRKNNAKRKEKTI